MTCTLLVDRNLSALARGSLLPLSCAIPTFPVWTLFLSRSAPFEILRQGLRKSEGAGGRHKLGWTLQMQGRSLGGRKEKMGHCHRPSSCGGTFVLCTDFCNVDPRSIVYSVCYCPWLRCWCLHLHNQNIAIVDVQRSSSHKSDMCRHGDKSDKVDNAEDTQAGRDTRRGCHYVSSNFDAPTGCQEDINSKRRSSAVSSDTATAKEAGAASSCPPAQHVRQTYHSI